MSYSTRGELLNQSSPLDSYGLASFRSADGFLYNTMCSFDQSTGGDICPTHTFDTRTSTLLSTSSGTFPPTTTRYSYDLAGRRTGNRQYDALNRILKATDAYAYGPGTIPYEIGGLTQHGPLGQTPTFTTDTANNVLETRDVKFGMDADVLPYDSYTGVTVYNRDPFGFVAAQSNKTGTSAWTVSNLFAGCDASDAGDTGEAATSGFTGNEFNSCKSGDGLYSYRTDGYFDGSLTFRGVRTYDADTQQWSTSDAYSGNPGNPISGLGYNYANNNPAMFADPSGFCSFSSGGSLPTIAHECVGSGDDLTMADCVIGCFGPDPLGPDGMPADWQIRVWHLQMAVKGASMDCGDISVATVSITIGKTTHTYTVSQAALQAAMASAGAAAGAAGGAAIADKGLPALGGSIGGLVPGLDLTGAPEVGGTMLGALVGRAAKPQLLTLGGTAGGWLGGGPISDLLWDALKHSAKQFCK